MGRGGVILNLATESDGRGRKVQTRFNKKKKGSRSALSPSKGKRRKLRWGRFLPPADKSGDRRKRGKKEKDFFVVRRMMESMGGESF